MLSKSKLAEFVISQRLLTRFSKTVALSARGSTVSVYGVQVRDMVYVKTVFRSEDRGSKLFANSTVVHSVINNDGLWTGVFVDNSAEAVLDRVVFSENKKFEVRKSQATKTVE